MSHSDGGGGGGQKEGAMKKVGIICEEADEVRERFKSVLRVDPRAAAV